MRIYGAICILVPMLLGGSAFAQEGEPRRINPDRTNNMLSPGQDKRVNVIQPWEMGVTAVSRPFLRKVVKIEDALSNGELELAENLIDELYSQRNISEAEELYLLRLEANLAIMRGDLSGATDSIESAIPLAEEHLSKQGQIDLLLFLFTLQIKDGQLVSALSSYEAANELDEQDADSPYRETYEMVLSVLAGNQPISESAQITEGCAQSNACMGEGGQWERKMYRDTALVRNVNGKVGSIHVVCEASEQTYQFDPILRIQMTGSSNECEVFVFGDIGTSFTFYEIWTNPPP